MWTRTDDPVEDFNVYNEERERAMSRLPICRECDHPIQSEECYAFDGGFICPECLADNHLKTTVDYAD